MKVGIGVITMGVRTMPIQLYLYRDRDSLFDVEVDRERVGPAHMRNRLLKRFYDQGCTHIFLFDDDCYPLMHGWERYFVEQQEKSGLAFFGIPESFKSNPFWLDDEIMYWDSIITPFAMHTRKSLETVGYYNTAYDRYGYEDTGFLGRCHRAGLMPRPGLYPSPIRSGSYIFSEDVYARNPTPNISWEDKQKYIEKNRPVLIQENAGPVYIPYSP